VEGFTNDHLSAFQRHGTGRVLIACDRDAAGDGAADKLAGPLAVVIQSTGAARNLLEPFRLRLCGTGFVTENLVDVNVPRIGQNLLGHAVLPA
jgi:hypothetical protein